MRFFLLVGQGSLCWNKNGQHKLILSYTVQAFDPIQRLRARQKCQFCHTIIIMTKHLSVLPKNLYNNNKNCYNEYRGHPVTVVKMAVAW